MFKYRSFRLVLTLVVILCLNASPAAAQEPGPASPAATPVGTAFTYQGQIMDSGGNPINASCDFQFSLWDDPSSGTQVGTTLTPSGIPVSNGLFILQLDFNTGVFVGDARWLEIAARCGSDPSFSTITPRQALTATPYALYASNADAVDGQRDVGQITQVAVRYAHILDLLRVARPQRHVVFVSQADGEGGSPCASPDHGDIHLSRPIHPCCAHSLRCRRGGAP